MAEKPKQHSSEDLPRDEEAERYSRRSILRSEKMYGYGFQSPGGTGAVQNFCRLLKMSEGMDILEVGSGSGGAAFHFAREYGAQVLGLDFAEEMIELCNERIGQEGLSGLSFRQGDIATTALEPEAFDLAWSRDCILYCKEKLPVWRNIHGALRPSGQLFVTDFCRGDGALSESSVAYYRRCGYHLQDMAGYEKTLGEAGFREIRGENITDRFIHSLVEEKNIFENNRSDFLKEFTLDDFEHLKSRWDKKIRLCQSGDLQWGMFLAAK